MLLMPFLFAAAADFGKWYTAQPCKVLMQEYMQYE
jgi:hypothetical protein